ncbi:MAG: hypothetical protein WC188_03915 [Candidatus Caldatribacteriota bacterium]|jgi:hypoxanthine phosphoribosyltransferase|nr:phosphoribosyltransferase [Patescibacteria group bacterium]
MEKEWKKIFISPVKFHNDIIKLAKMINNEKFNGVCGIPRGGSVVETYISHLCNLPVINLITIHCYFKKYSDNVLIVDDIIDTGKTLKDFSDYGYKIASVYYKPRSIIKPEYFTKQVKNSDWIIFPWESRNELPNRNV